MAATPRRADGETKRPESMVVGPVIEELEDEEEEFEGKRIELKGLKGRPELNGRRGRASKWDKNAQRMGVKLDDGAQLAVKMANLEILPPNSNATAEPTPSADAKAAALAEKRAAVERAVKAAREAEEPRIVDITDDAQQPQAPPLLVNVAGRDFDALRPALQVQGLVQRVTAGTPRGEREMDSATVEEILQILSKPKDDANATAAEKPVHDDAAVCAQALGALAKLVPGPRDKDFAGRFNGAGAAVAAMQFHASAAPVQAGGLALLRGIARTGSNGIDAVVNGGGVSAAAATMRAHEAEASVGLAAMEMLSCVIGEGEEEDEERSSSEQRQQPQKQSASSSFPWAAKSEQARTSRVWREIDRANVAALVAAAMRACPLHEEMSTNGCMLLCRIASSSAARQRSVCSAAGAASAVACLSNHLKTLRVVHAAIFLLAKLAEGDDACKVAVGNAGAAAELARVVSHYRAATDVLRLSLGALTQLAQKEAGLNFVLATPEAASAVVLGIRAHGSDATVLHEACLFIAALAYGGPRGRRAALGAGCVEVLRVAIRRFTSAQYKQTVSMAKTIVEKLETGTTEEPGQVV